MDYALQSRWQLRERKLVYYGLRNKEHLFRNEIRLTNAQIRILATLPRPLTDREKRKLGSLLGSCVVEAGSVRPVPRTLQEAVFCKTCCANDFMIPGLEFDRDGRCPLCQTAEEVHHLRSLVPLVRRIPKSPDRPYDVGLFYTGGKDSTFLLHQLSNVMGLRVLAMTWEIPFLSDSARKSMEGAKRCFPNVEFRVKAVPTPQLQTIYRALYALSENTCACPSLAYVLFYPDLVRERVPCFLAGNEPAQMLGLYYNHMAPKLAYTFADSTFLQAAVNLGRILILKPPLRRGQFHTLAAMRQLAYGKGMLQKLTGYSNELVDNIVTAIHTVPELLEPLRESLRISSRTGQIPAFVHLDFDDLCGGRYDWQQVKELLKQECGWVPPADAAKGLHTSCKIETCKEHSQFVRFYHCRSRMIPFSALELALASRGQNLRREDAIRELEQSLGFSLDDVPACSIMRQALEDTP